MIIYEGPSNFDGSPIVAIITGLGRSSKNPKTGDMLQLWILPREASPLDAVKSGQDAAVCGNCPYRPTQDGGCYVIVYQAPQNIWNKYKRGGYLKVIPEEAAEKVRGRNIRLGAYGDPAMIPIDILLPIVDATAGHTGYTHQWDTDWIDSRFRNLCMASVDSFTEYLTARSKGWRCFLVAASEGETKNLKIVNCPASAESGKKTHCEACRLCDGIRSEQDTRKDVFILPHGSRKRRILEKAATV